MRRAANSRLAPVRLQSEREKYANYYASSNPHVSFGNHPDGDILREKYRVSRTTHHLGVFNDSRV